MHVPDQPVSVEEYLRLDAVSEVRLEYHAGRIFAMSGSDWYHNRIVHRISILFQKGDCRSVIGDQRVHVDSTIHAYTYPDVVVVCVAPVFMESGSSEVMALVGHEVEIDGPVEHIRRPIRENVSVGRTEKPNGHRRSSHSAA